MKVRKTRAEIEWIKNLEHCKQRPADSEGRMCALGKLPLLLNKAQGPYCDLYPVAKGAYKLGYFCAEQYLTATDSIVIWQSNDFNDDHSYAMNFMIQQLVTKGHLEIIENDIVVPQITAKEEVGVSI